MSLYDYETSLRLETGERIGAEPPFAALIMAALRRADSENVLRIKAMWPAIFDEFVARRAARGGVLASDSEAEGRR